MSEIARQKKLEEVGRNINNLKSEIDALLAERNLRPISFQEKIREAEMESFAEALGNIDVSSSNEYCCPICNRIFKKEG